MCQNTYTNAEKLLEAADQLAQSGECEEEEIYQAARDLELRMQVQPRIMNFRKVHVKKVCWFIADLQLADRRPVSVLCL